MGVLGVHATDMGMWLRILGVYIVCGILTRSKNMIYNNQSFKNG